MMLIDTYQETTQQIMIRSLGISISLTSLSAIQIQEKLYRVSNKILFAESDVTYLVTPIVHSQVGRYFYLGNTNEKIRTGSILLLVTVIKQVITLVVEIEIVTLFLYTRFTIFATTGKTNIDTSNSFNITEH